MAKSLDFFDAFEPHTQLKHEILEAYLYSWAFKLLQFQKGGAVHFVDGFAGMGKDDSGNDGSPLIAARVAQIVQGKLSTTLPSARFRVIAIEENRNRCRALEKLLAPFQKLDPIGVLVRHGSIDDHLGEIEQLTQQSPTLYFLDPFGIRGLSARHYPRMLAGPRNEVFALFSDIGAARHRGLVQPKLGKLDKDLAKLERAPSLFEEQDDSLKKELREKVESRNAAREKQAPQSREIISDALGDPDWEGKLNGLGGDEARFELILMFAAALRSAGAQIVRVFLMRSAKGGHKYCLVHASKSLAGYLAMKEAVSQGVSQDALPEAMRGRMKEDLRVPVPELLNYLQEEMGGQKLRWAPPRDFESVQGRLLAEHERFDLFNFQIAEFKADLKQLGWWKRGEGGELIEVPGAI